MNPIIQALTDYVTANCSEVDTDARYNDMLDEAYSFDAVGGPFSCMSPSRVLQEVDPTAYRCGKNDYIGEDDDLVEMGNGYYVKDDVTSAQEQFASDIQAEIDELETNIDEADSNDDVSAEELATFKRNLESKQFDLAAVNAYTL